MTNARVINTQLLHMSRDLQTIIYTIRGKLYILRGLHFNCLDIRF